MVQQEICVESIPRTVYMSSNREERTLTKLKRAFRKNAFDHKHFDTFLGGPGGREYYLGVEKVPDFGEDREGREWQRVTQVVGPQGQTRPKLQIISKAKEHKKNDIVDLDQYDADDAIVHLAQKHWDHNKLQAVKYWERKRNKSVSTAPRGNERTKLRPLPGKANKGGQKRMTGESLFREFKRRLAVDRYDGTILKLEVAEQIKDFVEEFRQKKEKATGGSGFFGMLRTIQDMLDHDLNFQRVLQEEAETFRNRRTCEQLEGEDSDADTVDFEKVNNRIRSDDPFASDDDLGQTQL